jgi:D-alanyl-D-alanine carboxypeptidase
MSDTQNDIEIDYLAEQAPPRSELILSVIYRFARLFTTALIASLSVSGLTWSRSALLGAVFAAAHTAWREVSDRSTQGSIIRSLAARVGTGLRSPEALGWGNPGAPGSQAGRLFAHNIVTKTSKGGIRLNAHRDAIALLLGFIDAAERLGYDVRQQDTGAWNHRFMRALGRTLKKLSSHSWGIALDMNWSTNPQSRTLKTDLPENIKQLGRQFGLVWGGRFSLPDAMHWQLNISPVEARALTAELGLVY